MHAQEGKVRTLLSIRRSPYPPSDFEGQSYLAQVEFQKTYHPKACSVDMISSRGCSWFLNSHPHLIAIASRMELSTYPDVSPGNQDHGTRSTCSEICHSSRLSRYTKRTPAGHANVGKQRKDHSEIIVADLFIGIHNQSCFHRYPAQTTCD